VSGYGWAVGGKTEEGRMRGGGEGLYKEDVWRGVRVGEKSAE